VKGYWPTVDVTPPEYWLPDPPEMCDTCGLDSEQECICPPQDSSSIYQEEK
jgi:hypothetical protein